MSPWSRFPFVRNTFALIGGILAARYWKESVEIVSCLLGLLLLTYVLVLIGTRLATFYMWSFCLGLLGLGSIFLLGYLRWYTYEVRQNPQHLTHFVASVEAYESIALEDAHEKHTHNSVVLAVRRVRIQGKWQRVVGKVQMSWLKHTKMQVHYGDVLLIQ